MSSAPSWMKRLGVGGELAPFFKSVCVYFLVQCVSGESAPSVRAAAFKCAPILCLIAAVAYRCTTLTQDKFRYAALVCVGLSLSCVGDALLVWEQQLVAGMVSFGCAHAAYIAAFGWRPLYGRGAALAYCSAAAYAALVSPAGVFRWLVPGYSVVVATMAWRAAASGDGAACGGALLFVASDAALGYSLFAAPLPHRGLLVMPAYYMGQLGIAYSALRPRLTTAPPSHVGTHE